MGKFLEKFGCLSTIVLVVGIVILCKKVDWFCYVSHEPIEYCRKFPAGKHKDKALNKIIEKLRNDAYYFYDKFDNQKDFAAFIQILPESPQRDTLEAISRERYELIRDRASKIVFTSDHDWRFVENSVEDKYKPEIARLREDLERRWQEESSAWDIVCNSELSSLSDKRRLYGLFLEEFPDGEHALEANELLVSVLEEEIDEYEDLTLGAY